MNEQSFIKILIALLSKSVFPLILLLLCLNPAFAEGGSCIIGSCDTPGDARSVYVSGGYAYMADHWSGLQVIDISNPNNLSIIGSCDTPHYVFDVYVSGSYAYMVDGWSGLQVVNISNPNSPSIIGSCWTPGFPEGVYVSGSYAYVADGSKNLQVIDISNPNSPSIIGSCWTPGFPRSVYVSGSYAYVADGLGLKVIDISNPNSPSVIGSCDTPGYAFDVYVSGSHAYVADLGSGLQVIDISNPNSPSVIGSCDTPSHARGVYVSGSYAYLAEADSGLQVINISNSDSPSIIGSCDTLGYANGVYVSGSYAYMADGGSGLQVIDIDCVISPCFTQLTTDPSYDANPAWSPDGLKIAFNTNRANPREDIWIMNADGSNKKANLTDTTDNDLCSKASWSPDGTKITFWAYRPYGQGGSIWTMNADGSSQTKIYVKSGYDSHIPTFSPDGTKIVFNSAIRYGGGPLELYKMNSDGTDVVVKILDAQDGKHDGMGKSGGSISYSPDGKWIAFESERSGNWDIWIVKPDGSGLKQLTTNSNQDFYPAWSPDGEQIAFISDRNGNNDIWILTNVQEVINGETSNCVQLTKNSSDDKQPSWSPDGNEIVFSSDRSGNFDIWVGDVGCVSVDTGSVKGNVIDSVTGDPIEGAEVGVGENCYCDETDANGYYLIEGIPVGEYPIYATASGYSDYSGSIEIVGDICVRKDIQLIPENDLGHWFKNPGFLCLDIDESRENCELEQDVPGGEEPGWGIHGYTWDLFTCHLNIDECKFKSLVEDNNYCVYMYGEDDTHADKAKFAYSAVTFIQGDVWNRSVPWYCPKPISISDKDMHIDIRLKKGKSGKLCEGKLCEENPEGRVMYAINIWLKDELIPTTGEKDRSNLMVLDLIFFLGNGDRPNTFLGPDGIFHYQTEVDEELVQDEWEQRNFDLSNYIDDAIAAAEQEGKIYHRNSMKLYQAEMLIELVHAYGELTIDSFDLYYYPKIPDLLPDLTLSPEDISFSNPNPEMGETVTITATIHNIGEADVDNELFFVSFFDGAPENNDLIGGVPLFNIEAGGTAVAAVSYEIESEAAPEIFVVVDSDDDINIAESNEENNIASLALRKLPVPYFNQGKTQWCWLNSIAMILQYYGVKVHSWDYADNYNVGRDKALVPILDNRNIIDYINSKNLNPNIDITNPNIHGYEGFFHSYIKTPIDDKKPVFLSYDAERKGKWFGHAIVIVGYSIKNGQKYVYIHDPSGGFFRDDNNMFIETPYQNLWNDISGYIDFVETIIISRDNPIPPPHPVIYFNKDNEWYDCDIKHGEIPEGIESYLYLDRGMKYITSRHRTIQGFPEIEPGSQYLRWKNSNILDLNRIVASNPSSEPVSISVGIELRENNQVEFEGATEEINIESESQTVTIKNGKGNIPDITFSKSGSKELYLKAYLDGQIVDEIGPININVVDPSCFWGSATCPVDVSIIDPDGFVLSNQLNDIPGATYSERDINDDDDPDDMFIIPDRKIGGYQITVIPEPDAEPTDTYTLTVSAGGTTIVLAENVPISEILGQHVIVSTEKGINLLPDIKEDAITELEAINTTDKHAQKDIDKAIRHINKSLEDSLWLDASHLDPKHGHKVFDEEKKAVKHLMKITEEKGKHEDPAIVDEVKAVIDKLTKADELLAIVAISDAKNTPVHDPKKQDKVDREIAKAEEELSKAVEEVSKGKPDKAIDHYKKAWEHAQHAIEHAQKLPK